MCPSDYLCDLHYNISRNSTLTSIGDLPNDRTSTPRIEPTTPLLVNHDISPSPSYTLIKRSYYTLPNISDFEIDFYLPDENITTDFFNTTFSNNHISSENSSSKEVNGTFFDNNDENFFNRIFNFFSNQNETSFFDHNTTFYAKPKKVKTLLQNITSIKSNQTSFFTAHENLFFNRKDSFHILRNKTFFIDESNIFHKRKNISKPLSIPKFSDKIKQALSPNQLEFLMELEKKRNISSKIKSTTVIPLLFFSNRNLTDKMKLNLSPSQLNYLLSKNYKIYKSLLSNSTDPIRKSAERCRIIAMKFNKYFFENKNAFFSVKMPLFSKKNY